MIRSIAVLKDGRFAVADALAEEVRLFDGEGTYLRTFGGQGQGPGELMGMQGVFLDHEGMLRVRGPWEAAMDMLRVYDPDMNQLDSIPYHEYTRALDEGDPPGAWRIALGNGFSYSQVPFFAQPHQVVAATGEFWTSAEGTSQLEVSRWMPPGDTSLVLTSLRRPAPVTPAERGSTMAELGARHQAAILRTLVG